MNDRAPGGVPGKPSAAKADAWIEIPDADGLSPFWLRKSLVLGIGIASHPNGEATYTVIARTEMGDFALTPPLNDASTSRDTAERLRREIAK